jgi:arabinofuranosyltransferase
VTEDKQATDYYKTMFSTQQRIGYIYAAGCAILVTYVLYCLALHYVVDDSFITFRYAKNLVSGKGLVFNPGERVEGYTNFLWTMLLSGFLWANQDANLLHIAQALGIIFGSATIFLVIKFSWLIHRKIDRFGLIGAAFLALNSAFCAWSTGGLETTFFTFLIFWGTYSYISSFKSDKKSIYAPILLGLAAMTRPEGLLFFGVTSIHMLVTDYWRTKRLISWRTAAWFLAFAVIYFPYYVWRFTYYGYPLPNTFYAKVGSGIHQYMRGVGYLAKYLIAYGILFSLLPLPLLFKIKSEKWIQLFFLQVGFYIAYIIYVGGDGLAFFRFVVPIAPFIYILVQEGIRELYHWAKKSKLHRGRWTVPSAAVILVVLSLTLTVRQTFSVLLFPESHRWYESQSEIYFPGNGKDHSYLWFDNYFVDRLAIAAKWLDKHADPNALVASTPAGSIAYHMKLKVLDMLGLNDVTIAHTKDTYRGAAGNWRAGHEKGNGKYILSRSPDYILLGNVAVLPRPISKTEMAKKLVDKSEHEIWADPDFHSRYKYVSVKLNDNGIFKYFTFYKKKSTELILQ